MPANQAMDTHVEKTPVALQRLWNLTRARLTGATTEFEPELAETLPHAQVTILSMNKKSH